MKYLLPFFATVLCYCQIAISKPAYFKAPQVLSKPHHYRAYLWAFFNQEAANASEAHRAYRELITSDAPVYIFRGYIQHLLKIGHYSTLLALMPQIEEVFKNDIEVELAFVQALEEGDRHQEAHQKILALCKEHKNNPELTYKAAEVLSAGRRFAQAVIIIDDYLKSSTPKQQNFVFYFLKAQMLVMLADRAGAHQALKQCLELYPTFDQGWLFLEQLQQLDPALHKNTDSFGYSLDASGEAQILDRLIQDLSLEIQQTSIYCKYSQNRLTSTLLNQRAWLRPSTILIKRLLAK